MSSFFHQCQWAQLAGGLRFSPADCLPLPAEAKRCLIGMEMSQQHPTSSFLFLEALGEGEWGIRALQRSEIFFPQTQIFCLLCSCSVFLYFSLFSSAFRVFLIMTMVVKDKHCSQQCCSNKAAVKIAKGMQIKYHNHLEAVVSIKYKYFPSQL